MTTSVAAAAAPTPDPDLASLRGMTWHEAASATPQYLRQAMKALSSLRQLPLSTSMVSPEGFVVYLGAAAGRVAHLAVGSAGRSTPPERAEQAERVELSSPVVDRSAVANLRRYSCVTLDQDSARGPYELATLVASLFLAGVPVATAGLPHIVRTMIDSSLLAVADEVVSGAMLDPAEREMASIALRRRAHGIYGHRIPNDPEHPLVTVVMSHQTEKDTTRLLRELAKQTWANIQVHLAAEDRAAKDEVESALTSLGHAAPSVTVETGAHRPTPAPAAAGAYVAEFDSSVTYGPRHIEDLVLSLRYSEAACAAAPARFVYEPRHRIIQEHSAATGESFEQLPAPGTRLWHHGAVADDASTYVAHGCNTVRIRQPALPTQSTGPASVIAHREPPRQLDWLGSTLDLTPRASYFARANSPDRN